MAQKSGSNVTGRHQDGFTLLEQIVALVVLATLACVAIPAFRRLVTSSRLQAAQTDLFASLNHARSVAVTRGRRTLLCPSRDSQRCGDGLHWEEGWLIGHYRSSQADQVDGPPLLVVKGDPQLTILSTAGRQRMRYQVDGTSTGSNVTFIVCRRGSTEGALTVVASSAGRVYGNQATAEQAKRCAAGD